MTRRAYPWTVTDWIRLAHAAKPHLDAGMSKPEALKRAQRVLPRAKRLEGEALAQRGRPSHKGLQHGLERLARLSPEQLVGIVGAQAAGVQVEPTLYIPLGHSQLTPVNYGQGVNGLIRWENREWELLARRVKFWQSSGSNAPLSRLFIEAQEVELPPERRRSRGSLGVAGTKHLGPQYAAALERLGNIDAVPFDPMQRFYLPPQAAPTAPAPVEAPEPVAAPKPPATSDSALLQPPSPVAGPAPASSHSEAAHEAARVFGISMANALVPMVETMLTTHEQFVLAKVREEQRAHAEELAQSMSQLLLQGLDRMLGGGSQEAAHPGEAPGEGHPGGDQGEQPSSEPRKVVKIDVVGFKEGQHRLMVKHKLNGHLDNVDIRFVDPSEEGTYSPHRGRHILMLTHRVGHTMKNKLKASGCKPIYIKHTVGHVVTAIENLLQQQAAG